MVHTSCGTMTVIPGTRESMTTTSGSSSPFPLKSASTGSGRGPRDTPDGPADHSGTNPPNSSKYQLNCFCYYLADFYSYFRNFRLEVSPDDGHTWQTVHEGAGTNQACCDLVHVSFGGCLTARYFRLAMIDNWGYCCGFKSQQMFVVDQLTFSYCAGEFIE